MYFSFSSSLKCCNFPTLFFLTQRGTALLLEHLAGSLASTISVTTHLDIAPQHHLFMKGRNGSNIKHITQRTGAQIHFPDPNAPQKKSTVYIQGTIESVCLARQYLMVGFVYRFLSIRMCNFKMTFVFLALVKYIPLHVHILCDYNGCHCFINIVMSSVCMFGFL